jgi:hypothetical protein
VVISTLSGNIVDKLKDYYQVKSQENWENLMSEQTWIYLDLAFLFTEWGKVWAAVKRNIDVRADVSSSVIFSRDNVGELRSITGIVQGPHFPINHGANQKATPRQQDHAELAGALEKPQSLSGCH